MVAINTSAATISNLRFRRARMAFGRSRDGAAASDAPDDCGELEELGEFGESGVVVLVKEISSRRRVSVSFRYLHCDSRRPETR